MEKRSLGRQGLSVSAIGLGCMGMSEFYGNADRKESLATIDRALEQGITLIDTADVYGPYKNEELVGEAIRARRDQIVLATKFGIVRTSDPSFRGVNGRPEYVRSACDASLKRLGIDHIDVYYQHRVDPEVPIEDTVGAMAGLVKEGKVRFLGLSEAGAQTVRRAHRTHPISVLQSEYSLWCRDLEAEILPTIRELGIGLVAYSPLGRGFLTGRITKYEDFEPGDFRRNLPRFQGENFSRNLDLVQRVKEIALRKNVTPGQLALRWVLERGKNIVPIPGTTRPAHLSENVASLSIAMTSDEMGAIEAAMPPGSVSGSRYQENMMRLLGR